MSELEKKARHLTDEEMEQVTGGTNRQTDKDPKNNNDLGLGKDANNDVFPFVCGKMLGEDANNDGFPGLTCT